MSHHHELCQGVPAFLSLGVLPECIEHEWEDFAVLQASVWLLLQLPYTSPSVLQVCPKGLNPGKAIAKIKQSIHTGNAI